MADVQLYQLFQQGVAAIRAGDKAKGRELLTQVIEQDQLHEQAWLWLSAATDDKQERIVCLQNVMTINPNNKTARNGLIKLGALPAEEIPGDDAPPSPPEGPAPSLSPDEQWRSRMLGETNKSEYISTASIVKDEKEYPPTDFYDLANTWLAALIFKSSGAYEEEVLHAPFSHILINISVAVVLQVLAIVIPISLFLGLNRSPNYLLNPLFEALTNLTQRAQQISTIIPPQFRPAVDFLLPSGPTIPTVTSSVLAAFGSLLVLYVFASILMTFVSVFFQSMVTSRVAEWMKGKGDIIQLTHGLTIALVATSIVQLPVFFLVPALSFSWLVILLVSIQIYQFLQNTVAVNTAYRLDSILVAMGAVIFSGVVSNFLFGCSAGLLGVLIGLVSAGG